MIIKVCGISTKENIEMISQTNIDMIGLNFYRRSVRFISDSTDPTLFDILPPNVRRVGVFVNEMAETIVDLAAKYKLDYVQLHGDENPELCNRISNEIRVIKVFRINDDFDFELAEKFDSASYFLFDTFTKAYGGSGKKFNWAALNSYNGMTPFLLSGGIGPGDTEELLKFQHSQFVGIDINSKFENIAGIKDKNLLLPFINRIVQASN